MSSVPPSLSHPNLCQRVRDTCRAWVEGSQCKKHVTLHVQDASAPLVEQILRQAHIEWDEEDWHYSAPSEWPTAVRHERMALYILCLDAINFCFWPQPGYEYDSLATTLTNLASVDHKEQKEDLTRVSPTFLLSANSLESLTEAKLIKLFETHGDKVPPNMSDRCNLLIQVGSVLNNYFDGSALNLIARANGSAVRLVGLIVQHFEGFRDLQADIAFLKRAQICVGDWQAALELKFHDMQQLTTFADYRVPQILRHEGWLVYSDSLGRDVDKHNELEKNSEQEWSIRAATVVAVEELVSVLRRVEGGDRRPEGAWSDVRVDWYLWQLGEKLHAKGAMKPPHKVRTIYY